MDMHGRAARCQIAAISGAYFIVLLVERFDLYRLIEKGAAKLEYIEL